MDFLHFKNHFLSEKLLPLYLIHGEEEFFVREAISSIKSRVLEGDTSGLTEIEGEEISLSAILEEVRTPRLFGKGGRKLVIVQKADKLFKEGGQVWERLISSPVVDSVLVLVLKGAEIKGALCDKIKRKGGVINCKGLADKDLVPWIVARVKHYGKQITIDALHILHENAGNNLLLLDNHIEKLCLYIGNRNKINKSDVEELVSHDRQQKVFEFTAAIAKKEVTSALKMIHQLMSFMRSGEEALKVIPPLAWQMKRLLQAKRLLASGNRKEALFNELKVPYRFQKELVRQTHLFSETELERDYQLLLEADIHSKTDNIDTRLLLETLVFRLCK